MRARVRGDPERLAPARPALGYLSRSVSSPPLPDLPINEALPALAEALAGRRSVLLEAPPGAGKSTIVPLFLRTSPWLEGQKVVMSATLDLEPTAKLLGGAPIVAARGRSFDVATQYVARRPEIHLEQQTAQVVRTALREHDGDILCFLPGAAEIRRVQRALEDLGAEPGVRVLPLYGELEGAAQDAALLPAPKGQRKIVLATSIAETSLTIEGIRVVVDSGLRRYAEFDPASGMSRLVTTKVSQAAADQRRGRAGRLSAGHCYRLWSEGTQGSLAAQTAPEVLHADLAPLALELSCWGA